MRIVHGTGALCRGGPSLGLATPRELSLQTADEFSKVLQLSVGLGRSSLKFLSLARAGPRGHLVFGDSLPGPIQLPLSLSQLGQEMIPVGREGCNLRFESCPLFEYGASLILEDGEPVPLLLQLPPPPPEPIIQGVEDGNETLGIPDGIAKDLVVPQPLAHRGLLFLVRSIRISH